MTRRAGVIAFWLVLAVMLLVGAPMRLAAGALAIGERGLSARSAEGTLWTGRLVDARIGPVMLGTLDASLSPWGLLMGEARLTLSRTPGSLGEPLSGTVIIGTRSLGLRVFSATLPAGDMFAPLQVSSLSLQGVTARFSGGRCHEAGGQVRVMMAGDIGGLPLPEVMLGAPRCDGDTLLVPVASASGMERADVRIGMDGRFSARLAVQSQDAQVIERLTAAGFVREGSELIFATQGRF